MHMYHVAIIGQGVRKSGQTNLKTEENWWEEGEEYKEKEAGMAIYTQTSCILSSQIIKYDCMSFHNQLQNKASLVEKSHININMNYMYNSALNFSKASVLE